MVGTLHPAFSREERSRLENESGFNHLYVDDDQYLGFRGARESPRSDIINGIRGNWDVLRVVYRAESKGMIVFCTLITKNEFFHFQ